MMNCRPPQTVRGPRRIAFAPALRGRAPRFRVRSAAFFARRLRRFFQVIFSKGTYNREWYIVGRGAALPRAGHLLDPAAPAARFPLLPCHRRPHFFQQRKKWGKERRQKPMVFGFPLPDLNAAGKGSTGNRPRVYPPLPLTRRAVGLDGPAGLGDYQIAHLPPAAASVGAARWAAGI